MVRMDVAEAAAWGRAVHRAVVFGVIEMEQSVREQHHKNEDRALFHGGPLSHGRRAASNRVRPRRALYSPGDI